jgi:hyperosmotically inducible protein
MNKVKQSSMLALFTAMLVGVCACSDNGGDGKVGQDIDKATRAAKEKLAPSSDASRNEAAKTDAAFNDLALAAKVKAEILKDASLRTSDIYVNAQDGTVVLSGSVNEQEDATRAIQIAQRVGDVKSVESKLSVRSNG